MLRPYKPANYRAYRRFIARWPTIRKWRMRVSQFLLRAAGVERDTSTNGPRLSDRVRNLPYNMPICGKTQVTARVLGKEADFGRFPGALCAGEGC